MTETSILATDAYKFSMAQAGFPLRPETFYFSFRRGGFQYIPFDLEQEVRGLVASLRPTSDDYTFCREHGYGLTEAMEAALAQPEALQIEAVPAHTWVWEREPILTVTGPSFLVSWLEPMLLWLNYPIQLATHLLQVTGRRVPDDPAVRTVTCEAHAELVRRVADAIKLDPGTLTLEDEAYQTRVGAQVDALVAAAGGDPDRIFEVGMRSAVCMDQHRLALRACRARGVVKTSNVALARELEMIPIGTMGHEHVQRWGADAPAFMAMRDMRCGAPSYLLDTFDTMGSGIAAALSVMRQREHVCSIRYDSGNKFIQYLHACELFSEAGLQPAHILEDGLDVEMTKHFEQLRAFTQWPESAQLYGYGGAIVAQPMTNPLTRDRVSAVYKLAETAGEPRMKFGNDRGVGKTSVPGRPVLWRRLRGAGPIGIIGQAGEPVREDYVQLSGNPDAVAQLRLCNVLDFARTQHVDESDRIAALSVATQALVDEITEGREH